MKTKSLISCAVLSLLSLTSCNSGVSLTPQELVGTWKGEKTSIQQLVDGKNKAATTEDKGIYKVDYTPVLTFIRAEDTRGGKLKFQRIFLLLKISENLIIIIQ